MKQAHDKIVSLANELRLSDKARGHLNSMRKEVVEGIRTFLKKYKNSEHNVWYITMREEIKTGSLDRETALEGVSDIDVIIALNYKRKDGGPAMPSSKNILQIILSSVPDGYHTHRTKRSIKVSKKMKIGVKKKTFTMDVVPVLVEVSKSPKPTTWWEGVSKVKSERGWVKLNPKHQKEIMKKLSRRKGQKDDPSALIICLKRWRDLQNNPPCELPSYILEVLVWEDYKRFQDENDLTKRFNRIMQNFERIHTKGVPFSKMMGESHRPKGLDSAIGVPLLHDPSNTSVNLVAHLSKQDMAWWARKAKSASNKSVPFENVFT
jgi:hypothetical protein